MEKINKKKFLIITLVLTVLFLIFSVVPPTEAKTQNQNPVSAIDRIQVDYKAKKITIDEYILYKAWAVFKPEKLSGTKYELSAKDAKFIKSGTSTILEIKKNWNKLSSKTKDQLHWVFDRPTDVGGGAEGDQHILPQLTVSTGGNFTIHWTNGPDDGGDAADAPDLTDEDENDTPDYIDNIASVFDTVRVFEVTTRGFHAPPSDAAEPNDANNRNPDGTYDVFIYDVTGAYGALGYADPEQYPISPSYSYIVIDNDLEGIAYWAQQCPAHEFFHAIQFYYDCTEDLWWMETTAQYMGFEAYPVPNPVVYNWWWFADWFELCDSLGLTTFNGEHEYGNFHWAKRLSEDFVVGDTIIKEIWVECQTSDGLTAIDNVLQTHSSDLRTEFSNFTVANFFLEDKYVDGDDYRTALTGNTTYDGVRLEYEYDAATDRVPFTIDSDNVNWDAWMDEWAADYVTLMLDPEIENYLVCFDGLDDTTNYLVNLVTKKDAVITDHIFSLDAEKDGYVNLDYDTYDNVVLIIMNAGNTSTTDPSWACSIRPEGVFFDMESYTVPSISNITVWDIDAAGDGTVTVDITSDGGDVENDVTLTETGPATGIFTGSINLLIDTVVGDDGTLQVDIGDIITVTYDNGTLFTDTAEIIFLEAPTGLAARGGNTYVFLWWDAIQSSALAGYNVYRSTSSGGTKTRLNGTELVTLNSFQDVYLPFNTTYYYWVSAEDIYGNETDYSSYVAITTGEEGEVSGEQVEGVEGGEGGAVGTLSGCFIATACYGTPMAKEVRVLSNFRDEYLLTNSLGRFFVRAYYRVSPPIASFISEHAYLKSLVRGCLKPVVKVTGEIVER